jgi:hypothetical protein
MALTGDPRLPCFRGQTLEIIPCFQNSSEATRLDLMEAVIGFLSSQLQKQFLFRNILKAHLQPNKNTGPRIVEANIADSLDERQIALARLLDNRAVGPPGKWACRLPKGQWVYVDDDFTSTVHGSVLHKATVRVSSAFAPSDDIVIWGEGVSVFKNEACTNACTEAFAHLMVEDAARHPKQSRVLLHANHWKMPVADLLARVRSLHSRSPSSWMIPVPPSASGDDDEGDPAQTVTPFTPEPRGTFQTLQKWSPSAMSECPEALEMLLEVREVLTNMSAQSKEEEGWVDPSQAPIIWHRGKKVQPARVLGCLLHPRELLPFFNMHSEGTFEWKTHWREKTGHLHLMRFRLKQELLEAARGDRLVLQDMAAPRLAASGATAAWPEENARSTPASENAPAPASSVADNRMQMVRQAIANLENKAKIGKSVQSTINLGTIWEQPPGYKNVRGATASTAGPSSVGPGVQPTTIECAGQAIPETVGAQAHTVHDAQPGLYTRGRPISHPPDYYADYLAWHLAWCNASASEGPDVATEASSPQGAGGGLELAQTYAAPNAASSSSGGPTASGATVSTAGAASGGPSGPDSGGPSGPASGGTSGPAIAPPSWHQNNSGWDHAPPPGLGGAISRPCEPDQRASRTRIARMAVIPCECNDCEPAWKYSGYTCPAVFGWPTGRTQYQ